MTTSLTSGAVTSLPDSEPAPSPASEPSSGTTIVIASLKLPLASTP